MNFINQRIAEAYDRVRRGESPQPWTMGFQPLTEASLAHVLKKRADGYFIISACRSDWPEIEIAKIGGRNGAAFLGLTNNRRNEMLDPHYWNNVRTEELEDDLRRLGYGFVPVYGGFRERTAAHPNGTVVMEQSFFVPVQKTAGNASAYNAIRNNIINLGVKYMQEVVAICPPNGSPYYYVTNATAAKAPVGTVIGGFSRDYRLNDVLQDFFTSLNKVDDERSDFGKGTAKRFTFVKGGSSASSTPSSVSASQSQSSSSSSSSSSVTDSDSADSLVRKDVSANADESFGGLELFLSPEPSTAMGGHVAYLRGEINGSRYPSGKIASF